MHFTIEEGSVILDEMIRVIQENKQYLSDIDGAIGDGDHGINMNKGFTMTRTALDKKPGNLAQGLKTLSRTLMMRIGGSLGPLYGKLFHGMAEGIGENIKIDKHIFREMLAKMLDNIRNISEAKVGDKTLMDTLIPAVLAYDNAIEEKKDFEQSLLEMKAAAFNGKESTKDLVAKIGRASRLGERSRGVLDPGAVSCYLLLEVVADTIIRLISIKPIH